MADAMKWLSRRWRDFMAAGAQGRQQVTRAGLIFTVALLLVSIAAFLTAKNLLFLILAAMFSTFFLSGFVSRLALAGLELDLLLPEHISARRKVQAGVRVRNLKRWIPSFSIRLAGAAESGFDSILYFPVIPGGAAVEESVDIYFPRRGRQRERGFRFSTRFPFGFTERRENVITRHEIVIYPCLEPQPGFEALLESIGGEVEAMQRGRGHDFHRVRPYEALESARYVDWKATAHTGELQVREFASDRNGRVSLYLDLDAPDSPEWFEKAVECCAFLISHLDIRGIQIRLRTQNFDLTIPEQGNIHVALRYLALVSPVFGSLPGTPEDADSFQLVFSAEPGKLAPLGWRPEEIAAII